MLKSIETTKNMPILLLDKVLSGVSVLVHKVTFITIVWEIRITMCHNGLLFSSETIKLISQYLSRIEQMLPQTASQGSFIAPHLLSMFVLQLFLWPNMLIKILYLYNCFRHVLTFGMCLAHIVFDCLVNCFKHSFRRVGFPFTFCT